MTTSERTRTRTTGLGSRTALVAVAVGVVAATVFGAAAPSVAAHGDGAVPGGGTGASAGAGSLDAVGSLVVQRLQLADPVAQSKWLSGKPIADPAREQAVIDEAVAAAQQQGVDPALVTRVVRAQIEASKDVQRGLFVRWTHDRAEAPTTAPDLTTIRPKLDAIDASLVTAVGAAARVASDPRCGHAVDAVRAASYPGLDALHRKAVHVAWAGFCAR